MLSSIQEPKRAGVLLLEHLGPVGHHLGAAGDVALAELNRVLLRAHRRQQRLQLAHVALLQLQAVRERLLLHGRVRQPGLHHVEGGVRLRQLAHRRLPRALHLRPHLHRRTAMCNARAKRERVGSSIGCVNDCARIRPERRNAVLLTD
eukprot:892177-Prorocentrum_minimum.AAC.4